MHRASSPLDAEQGGLFEPAPRKPRRLLLSEQLHELRAPLALLPIDAVAGGWPPSATAAAKAPAPPSRHLPPPTKYSCVGQTVQFWAARVLCVPIFLVLVCGMFYGAVRFFDETFPTLTSVPAAARQIGFANYAFVHLYFPPSPPPGM